MKKSLAVVAGLTLVGALAEGIILAQMRVDPWRLGAVLASLALTLAAFVALTDSDFVAELRARARESAWKAAGAPFLLLIPYLVLALATETFGVRGAGKLAAYIAAPTLLLLPDRLRPPGRAGWRDFAAMLALAVPVSAGWLTGVWTWPQELYFLRPMVSVCVGAYGFLVLRNLQGVGYQLLWRWGDAIHGLGNFATYSMLAIPLGLYLNFLHPHSVALASERLLTPFFGHSVRLTVPGGLWLAADILLHFAGIYLTIAIPEELLFRGILQNFLARSISGEAREVKAVLIASVIFGASHLHHSPVPNWHYGIMATLAGVFYGNAYRATRRIPASGLTHALVDTAWHFWL